MSLDITPVVAAGKQLIQGYGAGEFRIANELYTTSILVFPDRTEAWPVTDAAGLSYDDFAALEGDSANLDILVVGCGPRFVAPPQGLRQAVKDRTGVVVEWMDTGAACRTFNVLLAEERRVAAALIALNEA